MRELPEGFRQKSNGQYEYRFTCAGRRRSVSGSTIRECKVKAEKLRMKDASGLLVDKSKITLREYGKEVIDRAQVKPTTCRSYTFWLDMLPAWILDMKLQKIDRRHIITAQSELSKSASVSSVNHVTGLLKQIFKEAILDQLITKNPCMGVKAVKAIDPPARETIHRALTIDEQKRLFDELRRSNCWYLELFELQILTGMRVGEACALHWADVSNSVIHVHATMSAGKYSPTTKTDSSTRDIPITPAIRKVLTSQREKSMAMYGVARIAKDKPVFCLMTRAEGHVNAADLNNVLHKACETISIDVIGTHAFRDTFATRAIEQGMQPNTLKELLGHASITMTMDLYAHVLPDTKAEAMKALEIVGI
jgi:integrase